MPKDIQMKVVRRKGRCYEKPTPASKKFLSYLIVIIGAFFFASCSTAKYSSYNPQNKIAPDKLRSDLSLLKKILEANHPSLYWYTSKDSIDWYFNTAMQSITDSLTEFQFRVKASWVISKVRCGHTSVRSSKAYSNYYSKHEANKFPLLFKVWGDTLVILGSLNKNDTIFKRGVVVNSIEGRSNRELLDSIFQFISTDGYADNFKNQAVTFNFPLYYSFAFPLKDSFRVDFVDSSGTQKETYAKLYKPQLPDTIKQRILPATRPPTRKERKAIGLLNSRSIIYDTSNAFAYMRVATFAAGKLRSFFKRSFEELKSKNTPNLIIDLRENTGGNISTSINLTRYIRDTPFHVADTAAAINRSLTYGKYIHPSWLYHIVMRFTTKKESDKRFHFREIEKRKFKPFHDLHYNGNVYVVQGGYTFSAAAMFVLSVKEQHNVTVVGEETGGGDYGTTAIHLPTIILPNSKLRITLPLYRIIPDCRKTKNGRGIRPDVFIPPSSLAIKNGIDPKLQKVKELIQTNAKNHKE